MKKTQIIGIIGGGNVGTSTAFVLQNAGLEVLLCKRKSKEAQLYAHLMGRKKGFKIINHIGDEALDIAPSLPIRLTTVLEELLVKADLILYCGIYPPGQGLPIFNKKQLHLLLKNDTPVIAFPGQLGSSWFLGSSFGEAGLVSSSPIFTTRDIVYGPQPSVTVHLRTRKAKLPLAHPSTEKRRAILELLNPIFQGQSAINTFKDGGTPIGVALGCPDPTINGAAICALKGELLSAKGKPITAPIYALGKEYSELFQAAFNDQQTIAGYLGLQHVRTLKEWLLERPKKVKGGTVTELLYETYKSHMVTISATDRRFIENLDTLLFMDKFAECFGYQAKATKFLYQEMSWLREKLSAYYTYNNKDHYITKSAISYADYIKKVYA